MMSAVYESLFFKTIKIDSLDHALNPSSSKWETANSCHHKLAEQERRGVLAELEAGCSLGLLI